MESSRKRKVRDDGNQNSNKQGKHKKQWRTPRQNQTDDPPRAQGIESGDSGIWVTCTRGKEAKCIAEMRDLFEEYARKLYSHGDLDSLDLAARGESIEDEISKELASIQKPSDAPLFHPVRVEMECVVFFKTRAPIEPVSLVHDICSDAASASVLKRTRFVKRLSPVTLTGKATMIDLERLSKEVLAPHFHQEGVSKKFAIRPTIRNSNQLSRDGVIEQVVSAVGTGHSVDLKAYDALIIVEIYKNVCGMSVVGSDYDRLKRYNLAEIYDPTPKPKAPADGSIDREDKGCN
ncbi:MAG: hypothetical protein Q9165_002405 [Trypethelium subeluteriae]